MRLGRARTALLLVGIGMGGFIDGIALHQIAHWHNMLSARIPPVTLEALKTNMVADGWFHALTWIITLSGVITLWAAAKAREPMPNGRAFAGYLLMGWGVFNLVEGIIDHHILELHHVRDVPQHVPFYDWAFLLIAGVGLIAVGWFLRSGETTA